MIRWTYTIAPPPPKVRPDDDYDDDKTPRKPKSLCKIKWTGQSRKTVGILLGVCLACSLTSYELGHPIYARGFQWAFLAIYLTFLILVDKL